MLATQEQAGFLQMHSADFEAVGLLVREDVRQQVLVAIQPRHLQEGITEWMYLDQHLKSSKQLDQAFK